MPGLSSFSPVCLGLAFVLDLILGDPATWPHPVRWIGRVLEKTEPFFYGKQSGAKAQRFRGALFWFFHVSWVLSCVSLVLTVASWIHEGLVALLGIWLAYTSLATRSLYDAAQSVAVALKARHLEEARRRLSHIVSRNTEHLDEEGIWRALLETVSENISDGVIAPLFYLAIAGPAGAMLYKAVNTMDSMVGYKNDRYLHFGWWAARADDVLNWIPARLSALALLMAGALCGMDWRHARAVMKRDAPKTSSPNAGYPEAVAAGLLGIMLGGPAVYFGKPVRKPTLGDALKVPDEEAFRRMICLLFVGATLGAMLAVLVRFALSR